MESIEFYTYDGRLMCMINGQSKEITERDNDLVDELFERIQEFYPLAYSALCKHYNRSSLNVPYFRFLVVSRFARCNFGELDTTSTDISSDGVFNFEKVRCPLRGECPLEKEVCMPKFNSTLSKAEERVMRLLYNNEKIDEIAEKLYLSGHTVKNHIKAAYLKLGVHSHAEFMGYAGKHHLFD